MLHLRLSAWQCLSRIAKDLVCQCKDFWFCVLRWTAEGGHKAAAFPSQITATLCAAHSAHVVVVCCALALWPCERPRPDNKHGRNGSYFLHLSTDNWIEPDRKRREREGRRRRKNIWRQTSGISQSKHMVRKSALTLNEIFQTSACCPPLSIRRRGNHDQFHFSLLTRSPGWERKTEQELTLFFKATAEYQRITRVPTPPC